MSSVCGLKGSIGQHVQQQAHHVSDSWAFKGRFHLSVGRKYGRGWNADYRTVTGAGQHIDTEEQGSDADG